MENDHSIPTSERAIAVWAIKKSTHIHYGENAGPTAETVGARWLGCKGCKRDRSPARVVLFI